MKVEFGVNCNRNNIYAGHKYITRADISHVISARRQLLSIQDCGVFLLNTNNLLGA